MNIYKSVYILRPEMQCFKHWSVQKYAATTHYCIIDLQKHGDFLGM